MKKLLITGGNGQLGRAINNLYRDREDIECINTDVGELDITNLDDVLAFVDKCRPYAIINCAAHTAVDLCEDQEDLAYKINAIGPRNLSIAAEKYDCKIMQISTDYVFAGDASTPYKEFDTPNPQGVYGASKLAGENFVKAFSTKYFIIRTAWLYGDGKNFVKTMLRLAEDRDEIGVVYDQVGSPTSTFELAKAMDSLLSMPEKNAFFRALSSWIGFKSTSVEFDVQEREEGESKWSTRSLIKYAITNIVSFSSAPMQAVTVMGVMTLVLSVILGIQTLVKFFMGHSLGGFTTVIMLILFIGSIVMISLGIIGYYISKIYEEVKGRPKYLISRTIRSEDK